MLILLLNTTLVAFFITVLGGNEAENRDKVIGVLQIPN
jgi:hypothetical protein